MESGANSSFSAMSCGSTFSNVPALSDLRFDHPVAESETHDTITQEALCDAKLTSQPSILWRRNRGSEYVQTGKGSVL
jgi:hypothetical protein